MKKILINVTEKQHQKLKEESNETGCSVGSIIRNVVYNHYKSQGDF